jgi:ATP-dependent Clp protease ATP-binding subunit ClpB
MADAAAHKLPQVQGQDQVQVGRDMVSLLQACEKEAMKRGDQYVASELFLVALSEAKSEFAKQAQGLGLSRRSLDAAILAVRGGQGVDSADAEDQRESLKKYCVDLTERARAGKLDPVIGRDDEIRRAIQVLQRRTKNNPVLIGEPGVGKTAIVEGLAQRIVAGGRRRRARQQPPRKGNACGRTRKEVRETRVGAAGEAPQAVQQNRVHGIKAGRRHVRRRGPAVR